MLNIYILKDERLVKALVVCIFWTNSVEDVEFVFVCSDLAQKCALYNILL
jgi:hypothetical protein